MAGRDQFGGGVGPGAQPPLGTTSTTTAAGATAAGLPPATSSRLASATAGATATTTTVAGQQRTSRRDQLTRPDLGAAGDPRSPGQAYGAGPGGVGPGGLAGQPSTRGSPAGAGRRTGVAGRPGGTSRSYNNSPSGRGPEDYRNVPQSISTSAFTVGGVYGDRNDPLMDRSMGDPRAMDRGMDRGMDHHRSTSMPPGPGVHGRSRSASRGMPGNRGPGYHSLDREGYGAERDFMPMREPRERSLDRDFGPGAYGGPYGRRERSLDRREPMLDDELYRSDPMAAAMRDPMMRDPMGGPLGPRGTRLSPNPAGPTSFGHGPHFSELQHSHVELQRDLANLKKELELTNQKLGSSMHSIKTFWSPELKKERALRKEESAKYSLINDQLKLLNSENQVGDRYSLCQLALFLKRPLFLFRFHASLSFIAFSCVQLV